MPRQDDGTYNLPTGNPKIAGNKITADDINLTLKDIETALGNSIDKDGSVTMTAALTLSGDPTADNHAANKAYVDSAASDASGASLSKSATVTLTGDVTGSGTFSDDSVSIETTFVNSPEFSGVPTAPTAEAGTNTTQIATTAFVSTAVSNLIDTAPDALNTLNELAAALNDDADFSTTVTDAIAAKVSKSGDTMTGDLNIETDIIGNSDGSSELKNFTINAGTYN